MIHNSKYDFAFYHVPKTGGSTIREYLMTLEGNEIAPEAAHEFPTRFVDVRYTWCVIRNPWDRMESCYRHVMGLKEGQRRWKGTFAEFVEDMDMMGTYPNYAARYFPIFQPQYHWALHTDDQIYFEILQEGFDCMAERLGFPSIILPKKNVSDKRIPCKWTPSAVKTFRNLYYEDINYLGYERPNIL